MKQRLTTLALAAAALFLFYLLFLPHPTPSREQLKLPTSEESAPDGLLAAWRWLQSEGIAVASLRERYDHLEAFSAAGGSANGNVLISSVPFRLNVAEPEWIALDRWLRRGNTLLVLAALDDTPDWSVQNQQSLVSTLERMTRMRFRTITVKQPSQAAGEHDSAGDGKSLVQSLTNALQGVRIDIQPRGMHPLLEQVQHVAAGSELPSDAWQAAPMDQTLLLALAQRADTHQPSIWLKRMGAGQILVLSVASPLSNAWLDHADNARLLANIVTLSRTAHARVIFDDAHQGLLAAYDPNAFFHDARLYRTLGWLLVAWLAFVLGPLALRDRQLPWQPVSETGIVEASGRFFASVVPRGDAARRLFDNFFNSLRHRLGLAENGAPLWDWLAAQPRISDAQRAELQQLFAQAHADEGVKLVQLHNLIVRIQEQIA